MKKEIIITVIGVILGAVSGYLNYLNIGYDSATCVITSKPLNSTLYGGLIGGSIFNMLVKSPKQIKILN